MFIYLSDIDGYSVMVIVGIGILMIIGGANGWVSVLIMIMIWPMFAGYMEWMSIWMAGLKLGESYKKVILLLLLISFSIMVVGLSYVFVIVMAPYRVLGVISLGVYVWIMVGCGMAIMILSYAFFNLTIEVNWKILVLRLIPLPALFLKQIGVWVVIYVVMYYGMLNLII